MNNHENPKVKWVKPTLEVYSSDVVQGGANSKSAEFVMGTVTYKP